MFSYVHLVVIDFSYQLLFSIPSFIVFLRCITSSYMFDTYFIKA